MIADHMQGLEKFKSGLWKIADNLRANSNLASNEYFMPIMGLILGTLAKRFLCVGRSIAGWCRRGEC